MATTTATLATRPMSILRLPAILPSTIARSSGSGRSNGGAARKRTIATCRTTQAGEGVGWVGLPTQHDEYQHQARRCLTSSASTRRCPEASSTGARGRGFPRCDPKGPGPGASRGATTRRSRGGGRCRCPAWSTWRISPAAAPHPAAVPRRARWAVAAAAAAAAVVVLVVLVQTSKTRGCRASLPARVIVVVIIDRLRRAQGATPC